MLTTWTFSNLLKHEIHILPFWMINLIVLLIEVSHFVENSIDGKRLAYFPSRKAQRTQFCISIPQMVSIPIYNHAWIQRLNHVSDTLTPKIDTWMEKNFLIWIVSHSWWCYHVSLCVIRYDSQIIGYQQSNTFCSNCLEEGGGCKRYSDGMYIENRYNLTPMSTHKVLHAGLVFLAFFLHLFFQTFVNKHPQLYQHHHCVWRDFNLLIFLLIVVLRPTTCCPNWSQLPTFPPSLEKHSIQFENDSAAKREVCMVKC